jgi:hypothetical protein
MQETIFTIGHSTHSQARFISLHRQHRVTALCDVRSQPYSRVNPQFNRSSEELLVEAYHLQEERIAYESRADASAEVRTLRSATA